MIAPEILTGEKAFVTAWFDNSRTDILKDFRCNTCGHLMFQYWDSLRIIAPGRVDDGQSNPSIHKCRGNARFTNNYGQSFSASCNAVYWINR